MKKQYRYVSIGYGLWARPRHIESLVERYLRKQAECPHKSRDPHGTCYECGHRTDDPFKGFGRSLTCG
jgi:hypothetical protein